MRDFTNSCRVMQAIAPALRTDDISSATIDRQGFQSVTAVVSFGVSGDTLSTSNKIEARLFDSDDGSNFTLVPDANLIGTVLVSGAAVFARVDAAAKANAAYKIGYRGTRRYLRILLDYSGTHSSGTPTAAYAIMNSANNAPVTDA